MNEREFSISATAGFRPAFLREFRLLAESGWALIRLGRHVMGLATGHLALAGFSPGAEQRARTLAASIGAACVVLRTASEIANAVGAGFSAIMIAAPLDRAIVRA